MYAVYSTALECMLAIALLISYGIANDVLSRPVSWATKAATSFCCSLDLFSCCLLLHVFVTVWVGVCIVCSACMYVMYMMYDVMYVCALGTGQERTGPTHSVPVVCSHTLSLHTYLYVHVYILAEIYLNKPPTFYVYTFTLTFLY